MVVCLFCLHMFHHVLSFFLMDGVPTCLSYRSSWQATGQTLLILFRIGIFKSKCVTTLNPSMKRPNIGSGSSILFHVGHSKLLRGLVRGLPVPVPYIHDPWMGLKTCSVGSAGGSSYLVLVV